VYARHAPALAPALGLVAGTCLAAQLTVLPRPACALLIALALALGGAAGRFVACLAFGLLHATAQWIEPLDALRRLELDRPVELAARVASHPAVYGEEVLFRVETLHVRQRHRVFRAGVDVLVTLPVAAAAPPLGAEVRLKGYLRRSSGFANTAAARPGPWRLRLKSAHFLTVESPPGAVGRLAARWRRAADDALERVRGRAGDGRLLPPDPPRGGRGLPLARALLLGDRSELPPAWQQVLRRYGLAHLLAVSGLHVGLLALACLALTLPLPRTARYLAALAAVAGYLLLVGPQPAVLRAAVMGLLGATALLLQRPPQTLNALACCVLAMVLARPAVVAELGFQLSVAATASIVVVAPLYERRWRRCPRWLRQGVAASLAAQVATFPLILPLAGGWHPLAVALNLVAVPWLDGFLACAFPWLLLALASAPAAAAALPLLDAAALPLAAAARLPPTALDLRLLAMPPAAAAAVALGAAAAGLWPRRAAAALLALALLTLTGATPAPAPAELVMLDVGQGDALVLRDGRRALLVDGGGWPAGDLGGRVLVPALAAAGVRRLDAALLTHGDLDHCGGLADLVRYLPVGEVWTGAGPAPAESCTARLLAAPGVRRRVLERGDVRRLGRWRLEVLHPAPGESGSDNDLSLVVMAETAGRRVLLTGDLEAVGEARLVEREAPRLRADVLKVAHHGSRTSTRPAFLGAVAPRLALISAGPDNPYGHPAPEVLERLAAARARVLRTDLSGRVELRFHDDGRILVALPAAPRRR
jgi:competence protein ComEC